MIIYPQLQRWVHGEEREELDSKCIPFQAIQCWNLYNDNMLTLKILSIIMKVKVKVAQ